MKSPYLIAFALLALSLAPRAAEAETPPAKGRPHATAESKRAPRAAATNETSAPGKPNILYCVADDWSYPHAGAYGCEWVKTPAFDRVAREGLLFTHCYTPNAKCAPSRASMLTGRNSWQLGAACNHVCYFPPEIRVYTEALSDHGYFVGSTGKGWAPGVSLDTQGMIRELAGQPYMKRKQTPPTDGISNCDYAGNFADFLAAAPAGKPWCFWYGGREPHRPYTFESGVKAGKHVDEIERVPAFWPDEKIVREDMLDYAFEVEHFDRHLGRMLKMIEDRGELENTLVIVTGDNGMPFPRAKGQQYDWSSRLPLAVMWPRGIKAPGRTIDDYVSFIDFAPTYLEIAGVPWSETGMGSSPGHSLTDVFQSGKPGKVFPYRDHVLIGQERHDVSRPHDVGYPIRGIVKDDMLFLINYEPSRWPVGNPETGYLNTDGGPTKTVVIQTRTVPALRKFWQLSFGLRPSEEFYSLADDRDCMHNLAKDPAHDAVRLQMRQQMIDELKAQNDPRMFGHGEIFEAYPYADVQRGFYERFMSGEKIPTEWVNPTDYEKRGTDAEEEQRWRDEQK